MCFKGGLGQVDGRFRIVSSLWPIAFVLFYMAGGHFVRRSGELDPLITSALRVGGLKGL